MQKNTQQKPPYKGGASLLALSLSSHEAIHSQVILGFYTAFSTKHKSKKKMDENSWVWYLLI